MPNLIYIWRKSDGYSHDFISVGQCLETILPWCGSWEVSLRLTSVHGTRPWIFGALARNGYRKILWIAGKTGTVNQQPSLEKGRSNDHPEREYTLSKVEAEETRKGCDMIWSAQSNVQLLKSGVEFAKLPEHNERREVSRCQRSNTGVLHSSSRTICNFCHCAIGCKCF